MTFARWGIGPLLGCLILCGWTLWIIPMGIAWWIALPVCLFMLGFTLNFFRNPHRVAPADPLLLISAADGVIADIEEIEESAVIGGRAIRIGVFMNVFNVHVNRAPVSGRVCSSVYKPGKYLDVRHPDCTHENEALTLGIEVDAEVIPDTRMVLRQLSGLIARRIVCTVGPGDSLQRGAVFGMIKFGSRVEHIIPVDSAEILVQVGDKVQAGSTSLARWNSKDAA